MKKERILTLSIIILILLNLTQLMVGFLKPKPPFNNDKHHPAMFIERAASILKLDAEQKKAFTEFGHIHIISIDSLNREHRTLLNNYFENPTPESLELIKKVEAEKIIATEKNFEQIKSILKEEQYQEFDTFKEEALKIILK